MKPVPLFCVALMLIGCKGDPGPTGPPGGPIQTGSIRGKVVLYDERSTEYPLPDSGGVTVQIQPQLISAVSESDGSWELAGVPPGIYSLKSTKPGFFTKNRYNFQFVGGGTYHYGTLSLQQVPTVGIHGFTISFDSSTMRIAFAGNLDSPDSLARYVMILLSKTPMNLVFPFEFDNYASAYVQADSTSFSTTFYLYPSHTLYGSTVYAMAFANARYSWYPTSNPATGRYDFDTPGVSFSEQRNVRVP